MELSLINYMGIMKKTSFLSFAFTLIYLSACQSNSAPSDQSQGIVLGDPATIVTEEDSQYLTNVIIDLKERTIVEIPEQQWVQEIIEEEDQPLENSQEVKEVAFGPKTPAGLVMDFGDLKVTISGIEETKEFLKQDPKKMDGLSYLITKGSLENATITVEGAKNYAVRQRYQSKLMLKGDNPSVLEIKQAGKYISGWETLDNKSTANSMFQTEIPYPEHLSYKKMNASALRSAVQKEVSSRRYSRKLANEWGQIARKSSSPEKAPYYVTLHSIQWQVSATNAQGQQVFKTIHLEL